MTNAERLATLRATLAAKKGVTTTDTNKDFASAVGYAIDWTQEMVTTRTVDIYRRIEIGRVTRQISRI